MTNRGRVTGRHGFEHMEVFQLALDFVDGVEPKLPKRKQALNWHVQDAAISVLANAGEGATGL